MTLLDFPGKVACTVFLRGCNYRCPFCHNSELLGPGEDLMDVEALLRFLKSRQGLLDGVCITGGEPTLQPGLPALLARIKDLGFLVKLDTNGTRPAVVKALAQKGLLDYVAVDAKNGPEAWAATVGLETVDLAPVEETVRFLIEGNVDYELRTTVVSQLHDCRSMEEMGRWVHELAKNKKIKRWFIQPFTDRDTVMYSGLCAPDDGQLSEFAGILGSFSLHSSRRG